MATLKLYLDKRGKDGDSPSPLKIAVNAGGSTSYIPLGVKLKPSQWDPLRGRVLAHPMRAQLQNYIDGRMAQVQEIVLGLRLSGQAKGATAARLRSLILERGEDKGSEPEGFMARLERYAGTREARRTRELYQATAKRVLEYCPGARSLGFEDVTKSWLVGFDRWLAGRSPSRNARNIHLRNIRAVFNDAIDDGVTACYPFRKLHIIPEPTRPRALTLAQAREIFKPNPDKAVERALDYFRLSFLLIGINTADMSGLSGVTAEGRVEYRRRKTHKLYSVRVEPEAMEIIRRRAGKSHLVELVETHGNTHAATVWLNKHLRRVMPGLTTYWARHTWATLAASIDVPADTISKALGHTYTTGAAVTSVYIDFDRRKVDDANRRVIDLVCRGAML